jgi:hypothetical protein
MKRSISLKKYTNQLPSKPLILTARSRNPTLTSNKTTLSKQASHEAMLKNELAKFRKEVDNKFIASETNKSKYTFLRYITCEDKFTKEDVISLRADKCIASN